MQIHVVLEFAKSINVTLFCLFTFNIYIYNKLRGKKIKLKLEHQVGFSQLANKALLPTIQGEHYKVNHT